MYCALHEGLWVGLRFGDDPRVPGQQATRQRAGQWAHQRTLPTRCVSVRSTDLMRWVLTPPPPPPPLPLQYPTPYGSPQGGEGGDSYLRNLCGRRWALQPPQKWSLLACGDEGWGCEHVLGVLGLVLFHCR